MICERRHSQTRTGHRSTWLRSSRSIDDQRPLRMKTHAVEQALFLCEATGGGSTYLRKRFGPAAFGTPGQRLQGLSLAPRVLGLDSDCHECLAPG